MRYVSASDFINSESWPGVAEVPDDALRHFREPRLSLFRIPSLADLPRLTGAFALSHEFRLEAKYSLAVDESLVNLESLDVRPGEQIVPDTVVAEWHLELWNLDEQQIRGLAFVFGRYGQKNRTTLGQVNKLVCEASDHGWFDPQSVKPGVQYCVQKALASRARELEEAERKRRRAPG